MRYLMRQWEPRSIEIKTENRDHLPAMRASMDANPKVKYVMIEAGHDGTGTYLTYQVLTMYKSLPAYSAQSLKPAQLLRQWNYWKGNSRMDERTEARQWMQSAIMHNRTG